MSDKYKTHEPDKAYFFTMTTVGWMISFTTTKFSYEKLNYIHQNPVQDMLVEKPEEYLFSSARNYAELPSLLDTILETTELKTYG